MTTRRSFLIASATAAGACAAGALSGCGAGLTAPRLKNDVVLTLTEFPALATEGRTVTVSPSRSGYAVAIHVRNEGGGLYSALGGYCDHEGCEVGPSATGFQCPCHGARFAIDGALLSGPATDDMPAFQTTFDGETVTVLANG